MSIMTTLSELTGDYVLDPSGTRIGFVARHTMGTRVRGQFEQYEGSAHIDGEDPSKSSTRLTIQAKSIQTRNQQRDDQLRDTFLDVDHHPTLVFTSTTVQQLADTVFRVTGDLTLRGVTKPVTVDLELTGAENGPRGGYRVGFKGGITINRDNWGVNWNAATRVLVSQKVVLELDIAVVMQT
ncbi:MULTISPECIES: YceI family protein [unclassified Streptomyces]|uniref:YceI family protein n=1 Tax=unclassified Streptomyces TaxID=2593676 RepID=UPI0022555314|nr:MULTISPECIES: YceI family protein [unclassified Streptomyces]MCX4536728.1 YceI family protein [Streptomyces sp. NBC_01669]WRZ98005.1 YceI family protein [Streptomyces sp. NBC_00841]